MKNTLTKTAIYSFLAILLLLLPACSAEQKLVGVWQDEQTGEQIEFLRDGTVNITSTFGMTVAGDYKVVDDSTLTIEMSGFLGLGGKQVIDYSISGNTLTLIMGGLPTEYTKVR